MKMRSWIRNLFSSRTLRKPMSRRRLDVDVLEDRTVPAAVSTLPPPVVPIVYTPNLFTDAVSVSGIHTLRDAIIAANAHGAGTATIILGSGTYALTIHNPSDLQENAARTGDLDITSKAHKLIIQGKGTVGATATIIDASALMDRVFQIVNSGTIVEIDNLIIKGGLAQDNGTAGVSTTSTPAEGGGIFNNGGNLTFGNVVFQSNTAQGGAGVAGAPSSPATPGQSAMGGGLYSNAGSVTIVNSTFSNNQALGGNGGAGGMFVGSEGTGGAGGSGEGGGVYTSGSITITNSKFDSDTARGGDGGKGGLSQPGAGGAGGIGQGGGVYAGGSITIQGGTFSSDIAQGGNGGRGGDNGYTDADYPEGSGGAGGSGAAGQGGGLYAASDTDVIANATFSSNKALGGSGGDGGVGGDGIPGDYSYYARGGNAGSGGDGQGGSVYAVGGSFKITNSAFSSNTAQGGIGGAGGPAFQQFTTAGDGGNGGMGLGGGLCAQGGSFEVLTSSFSTNTALGGTGGAGGGGWGGPDVKYGGLGGSGGLGSGGGWYAGGGSLHFTGSTFAADTAQGGNGGASDAAAVYVGNGGNGGDARGGGLYALNTSVTLTSSTFGSDTALGGDGGMAAPKRYSGSGSNGNGGLGQGGGLYASAAPLTISGSTFHSNRAQGGNGASDLGGDWADNGGDGGHGQGGALYVSGMPITITNATLVSNTATGGNAGNGGQANTFRGGKGGNGGNGQGAGLYVGGGTAVITNCTFSANLSNGGSAGNGGNVWSDNGGEGGNGGNGQGGALYVSGTPITITNTTLVSNTATGGNGGNGGQANYLTGGNGGNGGNGQGAGLYVSGGTDVITNCTFSANLSNGGSAGSGAFGHFSYGTDGAAGAGQAGGFFNAGTATLNNSIVAGSTGGDVVNSGTLNGSFNLIQDGSGGLANTIAADPLLGPLANNGGPTQTMALLFGSPAIDKGSNALIPAGTTTDQSGRKRIVNVKVDIGAFEVSGFSNLTSRTIVYGTPSTTLTGHIAFGAASLVGLSVSVSLNSVTKIAAVDSSGNFTVTFSTTSLNVAHGPYTVTYAFAGNTSFSAVTDASTKLTVNKATLRITANASKSYGTLKSLSGTFTQTGLVTANGDTLTGVTLTSAGTPVSATAGAYPIVVSAATGTGFGNYNIVYVNGTLTVNKATLTITANNDSKTYGTLKSFSTTAFTQTGLVTANGDTLTGVTLNSTGTPATAAAGSYDIVASAATGNRLTNYTIIYVKGTLTVNKAALTITANNDSKTYGTLKSFSATAFTQAGLLTANGDTITGVTEISTGTPALAAAGAYPIAASAATGNRLTNYTITYVNGTLTVNKATLTITANNDSKTYGTLKSFSVMAFTQIGLVTANGDTITGVTETSTGAPALAAVGTYGIGVGAATGNRLTNYSIVYVNGTLTVNKAALTITAKSDSKTYGTLKTLSPTAFTQTGLVTANGDTITGVTETSTGAPVSAAVGAYPIAASAATGNRLSNYSITYVSGTLTVNKATLTIKANNDSKTFGDLKTFSGTAFTQTGLVSANGDTITGVSETSAGAAAAAAVGLYPITASAATGTGLSNYTIAYATGTLNVNYFSGLTSRSSVYGTPAVTLTGHIGNGTTYPTGASVSITLNTFTHTAAVDSSGNFTTTYNTTLLNVGTYVVTYAFAGNATFSAVSDANTRLTVTKAALTITANNDSKTYGTLKTLAFTQTGLLTANGDTITGVTLTSTGTPALAAAGTYGIGVSAATGNRLSNYSIVYVNGTLTVNKAALTITAKSDSKTYGTLKTLSPTAFTQTGLVTVNGDTLTGVTLTSTGTPVSAAAGSYDIVASAATGNRLSNYTITYVKGTLAVNKAALTITAANDSKTYGTLKTFSTTAFTQTGLVTANGDSITGVTESSGGAPVSAQAGTAAIVASAATGNGLSNYTISYVNGTLTVNKAALTITANNDSKTYGTLKSFSGTAFTQTGLVTANGDTITGVTETSTGAPALAAAGAYGIVASAATGNRLSNYTISYVNGTLTVNKAALTITASNASKTYGTLKTLSPTAFTQTGLVTANGDTITGVTEISTGTPASAVAGAYSIGVSAAIGNRLSNYNIVYINGTLTVNKATLTITAANDSKIYGTLKTFSTTAFTQTGLVTANGDSITGVTETSGGAPVSAQAGTAAIVASAATGNGLTNYNIVYINGTLTVNKAALTIKANNDGKPLGTLKTFSPTAFTQIGLVTANGDTITGVSETSPGAAATATLRFYPITASAATGTGLSNYTITYVNGTLTVSI